MDYKGQFKMGNARWCYPLTVLDDHSRYSLEVRALEDQRGQTARQALIHVFRRYGLPWAMLMDWGKPWATGHSVSNWTKLSVRLLRLEIRVIHGRPPQASSLFRRRDGFVRDVVPVVRRLPGNLAHRLISAGLCRRDSVP